MQPAGFVAMFVIMVIVGAFLVQFSATNTGVKATVSTAIPPRHMELHATSSHAIADVVRTQGPWPKRLHVADVPHVVSQVLTATMTEQTKRGFDRVLSIAYSTERLFQARAAIQLQARLAAVIQARCIKPSIYRNALHPANFTDNDGVASVPIDQFIVGPALDVCMNAREWTEILETQRPRQLHVLLLEQCADADHVEYGPTDTSYVDRIMACAVNDGYDWPPEVPVIEHLLRKGSSTLHQFDLVVLLQGDWTAHLSVVDLAAYVLNTAEKLLAPMACSPEQRCGIHLALTHKFYKHMGTLMDTPSTPSLELRLSPLVLQVGREAAQRATGQTIQQCRGFVWRAVWVPGAHWFPIDHLNETETAIVSRLRAMKTQCVVVSTDFTVFDGVSAQMSCADGNGNLKGMCARFAHWRPRFVQILEPFHPIILGQHPQEMHWAMAELGADYETVSSFLDLSMLVEAIDISSPDIGSHSFQLASQFYGKESPLGIIKLEPEH